MRTQARGIRVFLTVVAALAGMAQSKPGFLLFTDPGQRFAIEFPKDWQWTIISGSGEPLATFVHPRKEAAVVVERFRMKQRLAPEDITDLFAKIEADYIKENQPRATDIVATINSGGPRRTIVINYTRPGLAERERVRQYSFPIGQDLYRVTCMTLMSEFTKYETMFGDVAGSLRSAGELSPARNR